MKQDKFRISATLLGLAVISSIVFTAFAQTARPAGGFKPVIWHYPGRVERLDFTGGAGGRAGAPAPPFTFVEENKKGTNPKIKVKDSKGVLWSVKWGEEVRSENFATRIAWSMGYFVDAAYFVPKATIKGVSGLDRAKDYVNADGSTINARFERDPQGVTELEGEQSWSWISNPFANSHEFKGLKIVMMLVSNWDNKDVRDAGRGSNTAIVQTGSEARYMVTDWGGSMGKWGGVLKREKWDCKNYAEQNKDFIKGVKGNIVEFGYSGQHTDTFAKDITVEDVKWLMTYLGRVSDGQLRAALDASGATPGETTCFTAAVRDRINQLRKVSQGMTDNISGR